LQAQSHHQSANTASQTGWPEHMRPRVAANYLGLSKAFLDQSRVGGTGPKFARISRTCVLYRKADLDDWLTSHLAVSTSEVDMKSRSPKRGL
jgi:hypothetical protein